MVSPTTQFATPDRFHPADGAGVLIRPVAFEGHAGWLHLPAGPTRAEVGVILAAPPGREGRSVHRQTRTLAERLALEGFPTLRFDLLGVGDSLDPAEGEDVWAAWIEGVKAAVAVLEVASGVQRIILAGADLSASLMAVAEVRADGLILLSPVVDGGLWMDAHKSDDALLAGLSRVRDLDLTGLEHAPERTLIGVCDASAIALADRLNGLGSAVAAFEDDSAFVADGWADQVIAWLREGYARRVPQDVGLLNVSVEPAALHPPAAVEHPVGFGDGLHGILCLPAGAPSDGRAVVFVNTGQSPRAGVGRFAVEAARTLAGLGIASLRFDFAGLGDSEGDRRSHAYAVSRQQDLTSAVTLMAAEGFPEITLAGAGSGAFHAIQALIADPRIGAVFAVGGHLAWRPGDPVDVDDGPAPAAPRTNVMALLRRWLGGDAAGRALREGLSEVSERGGRAHLLVTAGVDLRRLESWFGPGGAKLTAMPGMSVIISPNADPMRADRAARDEFLRELISVVGEL